MKTKFCITKYRLVGIFVIILLLSSVSQAKTVEYELIARKSTINLSGQQEVDWALMINDSIPAPTLEFTEGDDAVIKLINQIPDEEVSIHWHGILLPPIMDGVPYITTPPILPGQSFTFRFKIRQHGTYWYHSHTSVQEQRGVYGAIVIHPKKPIIKVDRDVVLVVSDWSDERADKIMKNLKKDGDYYMYKKGTIRSWWGAMWAHSLGSFIMSEWTRMGGMDLSDVGYDAFLINGKKNLNIPAKPGERLRLRIINAGASSYFYVTLGKKPMRVIAADGVDVEPVAANELLMGMAETYDVLYDVPDGQSVELKATAQDVTGSASAWIGDGEKVFSKERPVPNLYAEMDHGQHADDDSGHNGSGSHGEHGGHSHHSKPAKMGHSARPAVSTLTVDDLRSQSMTHFHHAKKTHDVKLVLDGDMERYVWHINGKALFQERSIEVEEGEIVRFQFVNNSMMHHPMHLHGHFFRVLNKSGHYSPLKHTVDVPPHGTRTIEFLADEPGQWMFHCHNLYHMKTGMTRIVSYKGYTPDPEIAAIQSQSPMFKDHLHLTSEVSFFTNHISLLAKGKRTWDDFEMRYENSSYDNLNEAEADLWYRRWFGKYFSLIAGGVYYAEYMVDQSRASLGFGYILPFLIETNFLIDHRGEVRLDVEKRFQWTKFIFTDIEATFRKNATDFEATLMYANSWTWAAGLMFSHDEVGAGLQMKF